MGLWKIHKFSLVSGDFFLEFFPKLIVNSGDKNFISPKKTFQFENPNIHLSKSRKLQLKVKPPDSHKAFNEPINYSVPSIKWSNMEGNFDCFGYNFNPSKKITVMK